VSRSINFIHIGYPKTGSTWFQYRGFKKHPKIGLLNYDTPEAKYDFNSLLSYICEAHDLNFSPDEIQKKFKNLVLRHNLFDDRGSCISKGISAEMLSGNIYNGQDSVQICDRLFSVFGPVKIIIIIRSQIEMIESIYKQYVHEGGTLGINKFLDNSCFPIADLINRLQYQKLINYYYKIFGESYVFVGLYEMFKFRKEVLLKELYDFLEVGTDHISEDEEEYLNRSHHPVTLKLDRFVNLLFNNRYGISLLGGNLFNKSLKFRDGNKMTIGTIYRRIIIEKYLDPYVMYRFFKAKPLLKESVRESLNVHFYDCNKYLSSLLQIDLREFGYPVEE